MPQQGHVEHESGARIVTFLRYGVDRYRREHDTPGPRPEALSRVPDGPRLCYYCVIAVTACRSWEQSVRGHQLVCSHVQAECGGNYQCLLVRDNGAARIGGGGVERAEVTAAQIALGELRVVQRGASQVDIAE